MCLIVLAHTTPLVIAANRDEAHARPTLRGTWWEDAPDVIGGRDLRAGGSWLAVRRGGRFAAVTNVHGLLAPDGAPSRGNLVREFVTSDVAPFAYVERIAAHGSDYAGFHLLAGEAGRDVAHYTNAGGEPRLIEAGSIFAISNAPHGESWPKTERAIAAMRSALQESDPAEPLMRFLTTPTGGDRRDEVFIVDPVYGTRASTVVIAGSDGFLHYAERNFDPSGVRN